MQGVILICVTLYFLPLPLMCNAHDAAAYDKWFRAQLAQALKEADDPATVWLSNAEVNIQNAARRAEWLKHVGQK